MTDTNTADRPVDELSEEELRDEVRRLRSELADKQSGIHRRTFVRGGLTLGGLATLLYASDPVAAASGTYPAPSEPPFEKLRAERFRYDTVTSDPSSPAGGDTWVVE